MERMRGTQRYNQTFPFTELRDVHAQALVSVSLGYEMKRDDFSQRQRSRCGSDQPAQCLPVILYLQRKQIRFLELLLQTLVQKPILKCPAS